MAEVRETGARNKPDIASADYCKPHRNLLLRPKASVRQFEPESTCDLQYPSQGCDACAPPRDPLKEKPIIIPTRRDAPFVGAPFSSFVGTGLTTNVNALPYK
jgi:hypothetical protein